MLLFGSLVNELFFLAQLVGHLFEVELLLVDFLFETADFIVIFSHGLLELHVASALLKVDLRLEVLDLLLDGVQSDLLNQNLVRWQDCRLCGGSLLGEVIHVLDAEAGKHAVDADGEQLAVVVIQTHPFNLLRVSLHFDNFLHCAKLVLILCVTENLNGAGTVGLSKTSIDQAALVANEHL